MISLKEDVVRSGSDPRGMPQSLIILRVRILSIYEVSQTVTDHLRITRNFICGSKLYKVLDDYDRVLQDQTNITAT